MGENEENEALFLSLPGRLGEPGTAPNGVGCAKSPINSELQSASTVLCPSSKVVGSLPRPSLLSRASLYGIGAYS